MERFDFSEAMNYISTGVDMLTHCDLTCLQRDFVHGILAIQYSLISLEEKKSKFNSHEYKENSK